MISESLAAPPSESRAITLKICHRVKSDARAEYESWLKRIIYVAAQYPGHLGVHILRPAEGHNDYEIALRFASHADAGRWLESAERKALINDALPAFREEEVIEIQSGIDYWFSPPSAPTNKQPVRWKQWLVTTSVIWPLTLLVPVLLTPLFALLPWLSAWGIRHGIVAASVVGLVIYVVMPRVVRLVAPWMFR
ncbi:antibiotic biosynthesis monooxygenase [Halomonas sp. 5021]|jgi:antibiotic biosynthesis monooxygenase (ABM) superfamily enzyme|uniref:antibiotic biosynthesis monooxygenase n=1 Tax=unclassified Halomonas TaxID=2609666 RepID=UPI000A288B39|nr:antibiotic biosynthesis monooxygenase [Halomonas sp. CSM-2]